MQVLKLNQYNKMNDRYLILSETFIYKVDPRNQIFQLKHFPFYNNI